MSGPVAPDWAWTLRIDRAKTDAGARFEPVRDPAGLLETGGETRDGREVSWAASGSASAAVALAALDGNVRPVAALRGAFSALAFDPAVGDAILIRDHLGRSPLFYALNGDLAGVSDSAPGAAEACDLPIRPNRGAVLNHLGHAWPDRAETYLEGVRRVPPACAVRLTQGGPQTDRFWNPAWEVEAGSTPLSDDDFLAAAREAVRREVVNRSPGIFLSGGLDSVGVASLASEPGAGATQAPLALSLAFTNSDFDETGIQTAVARRLDLEQRLAGLEEASGGRDPLSAAFALTPSLDSPPQNIFLPAFIFLAREAAARGCDPILTGTGGDEWLGITPLLAADLVARGRLFALAGLFRALNRSNPLAATAMARTVLWTFGARVVLTDLARTGLRSTWPAGFERIRQRRADSRLADWLSPAARAEVISRQIADEESRRRQPGESHYSAEIRMPLEHAAPSMEAEEAYAMGRTAGTRISSPLLDPDLVTLLYGGRVEDLIAGGRSKGPMRSYLASQLPGLGFERQRKPVATSYMAELIRTVGVQEYRRAGGPQALADWGLVSTREADRFVAAIENGTIADRDAFGLWDILALELWLRSRA